MSKKLFGYIHYTYVRHEITWDLWVSHVIYGITSDFRVTITYV